ncbi:hypothetical protein SacglDRAFT_01397 [Saccharomonospora glauca K62]|jgi:hypothetical protein|uniref:Uncharacterized protein n=1 Tax=Saccharomonospora glauca K62 TaxID=928724 RepID=I1D046_9PSEU|nr:hypothetical protein SacglDRAFT_01397 [Saccharomonospora glauca K62]
MLSRKRIRIALIALIVLAIVGWFAQRAFGVGNQGVLGSSLPGAEPASGGVTTCDVLAVPQWDQSSFGTRETLVVHTSAGICGTDAPQRVTVAVQ